MIKKIRRYLIAAISLVIGSFLPYLYSLTDRFQIVVYGISFAFFAVGLAILFALQYHQRVHRVKYAVLVFAVDGKGRLLTVENSYHHRIMIPCGVLPKGLTPGEAATLFLKEQAGIDLADCRRITAHGKAEEILDGPIPTDAQIEFVTKHERHVSLHYAFVYFLELKSALPQDTPGKLYSVEELESFPPESGLFSDILARYKNHLKDLKGGAE